MTRRVLLLLALLTLGFWQFAPAVLAADASTEAAVKFIQSYGNDAIKDLTEDGMTNLELQTRFAKYFDEGFDFAYISRFVLGRHWRRATPDERKEFQTLFKKMVVQTYSRLFRQYSGEVFKVTGATAGDDGGYMVASEVIMTNGEKPIDLNWQVEKDDGKYKIRNLFVQGASLIIANRSEFASVIQRGGGKVEALITALQKKTEQLASKDNQQAK
ncbi:MAG: ABC transporter substrate-binding protein [Rhodospirillaceae bacterium]|jgi:phospholipid transport system substrate-binding protein|nr:ABC transporter substrate-binding protein [Rhodospirillaceae bacterium]MBT5374448.1 ABC transporter substrate-binding protein [Rhodospirillaceae bacterium]MBT5659892.1 ABC transporter substrate-binding protein [Rhodospirillaceae bacterium]MBT5752522.1 ABC transporter substrate-binding protein [Rhodospirillaceae bacterium]